MVQGVGDHLGADSTRKIIFEFPEKMVFSLVNSVDDLCIGTIDVNLIRCAKVFEFQSRTCTNNSDGASRDNSSMEYLKPVREFMRACRLLINQSKQED